MKTCTKCQQSKELNMFAPQTKGRYGVTSICKVCTSQRGKDWHKANRERSNANKAIYNASIRERQAAYAKVWRSKNRERIAVLAAIWTRENLAAKASTTARRRTAKLRAIPAWASMKNIKKFYVLAAWLTKTTGIKANVDHIIPLQSELVCGLHCEANLEVITERENKIKGNLYWPDMPLAAWPASSNTRPALGPRTRSSSANRNINGDANAN